jgi:hypothetical protein
MSDDARTTGHAINIRARITHNLDGYWLRWHVTGRDEDGEIDEAHRHGPHTSLEDARHAWTIVRQAYVEGYAEGVVVLDHEAKAGEA